MIVTNAYGSDTSGYATLTVGTPPTVTVDPSNATVLAPATTSFSVTATGDATLTYQWQKGTTNVSSGTGGTTATYTIPASALADNGTTYRSIGADTSAAATLTVHQIPIVTVDPSNATVTAPATATFSVTATGTATLTYQWRDNGAAIPSATSSSYTTSPTTYLDNGAVYDCIVTNAYGADTSAGATLTANSKPLRLSGPSSISRYVGQTAPFSVSYVGNATITYQWQKGTTNVSTGTGGTTANYTTAALILGDNGNTYRVIATNSFGADTSSVATLTVTTAPLHTHKCGPRRKMGIGH